MLLQHTSSLHSLSFWSENEKFLKFEFYISKGDWKTKSWSTVAEMQMAWNCSDKTLILNFLSSG